MAVNLMDDEKEVEKVKWYEAVLVGVGIIFSIVGFIWFGHWTITKVAGHYEAKEERLLNIENKLDDLCREYLGRSSTTTLTHKPCGNTFYFIR